VRLLAAPDSLVNYIDRAIWLTIPFDVTGVPASIGNLVTSHRPVTSSTVGKSADTLVVTSHKHGYDMESS
jgi:hypothetical protein